MPLRMRGSVSARLSVRFSDVSAARKRRGRLRRRRCRRDRARERRFAANDVQRRAAFRAGLGQHQRAVREVEAARSRRPASFAPAAANAVGRRSSGGSRATGRRRGRWRCACRCAAAPHRAAFDARQRRSRRCAAGTRWPRARVRAAAHDARLERCEVGRNIGQFRHRRRALSQRRHFEELRQRVHLAGGRHVEADHAAQLDDGAGQRLEFQRLARLKSFGASTSCARRRGARRRCGNRSSRRT